MQSRSRFEQQGCGSGCVSMPPDSPRWEKETQRRGKRAYNVVLRDVLERLANVFLVYKSLCESFSASRCLRLGRVHCADAWRWLCRTGLSRIEQVRSALYVDWSRENGEGREERRDQDCDAHSEIAFTMVESVGASSAFPAMSEPRHVIFLT
jgi:hypothetical protein